MLLAAIVVLAQTTLSFTITPFEADSACNETTRPERVALIRLYGAQRYDYGHPHLIRQRPATAGPDTLQVITDGGWTYWPAVVDSAGNESCHGNGITVGVPLVGVAPPLVHTTGDHVRWIDPSGRALQHRGWLPLPEWSSGIYWRQVRRGREIVGRTAFVVLR